MTISLVLSNGIKCFIFAHLLPIDCYQAMDIFNEAFHYQEVWAFCEYTTEDLK
jgi:hypothetical protein